MRDEIRSDIPFNDEGVDAVVDSTADHFEREFLKFAIAIARMRFIKWEGMSESQFREQLPLAPFDMTFFAKIIKAMSSKREVLEAILGGRSVAEATGWDD